MRESERVFQQAFMTRKGMICVLLSIRLDKCFHRCIVDCTSFAIVGTAV